MIHKKVRGVGRRRNNARPSLGRYLLDTVAPLHTLHAPLGIHNALLSSEEGVAIAAHLNPKLRFSGAGGKGMATGAGHFCIRIILGMDLSFHDYLETPTG